MTWSKIEGPEGPKAVLQQTSYVNQASVKMGSHQGFGGDFPRGTPPVRCDTYLRHRCFKHVLSGADVSRSFRSLFQVLKQNFFRICRNKRDGANVRHIWQVKRNVVTLAPRCRDAQNWLMVEYGPIITAQILWNKQLLRDVCFDSKNQTTGREFNLSKRFYICTQPLSIQFKECFLSPYLSESFQAIFQKDVVGSESGGTTVATAGAATRDGSDMGSFRGDHRKRSKDEGRERTWEMYAASIGAFPRWGKFAKWESWFHAVSCVLQGQMVSDSGVWWSLDGQD